VFSCQLCDCKYSDLSSLQQHMARHERLGAEEEVSCPAAGCGMRFLSAYACDRHVSSTHQGSPRKLSLLDVY
jgi:hypothetical protein